MINSFDAFNEESIDTSQVYLGNNNRGLANKASTSYDLKWDFESIKDTFKSLCRSLINVHREVCVMEDLSFIVELLTESYEKLKTECLRIGALPKSARIPKVSQTNLSMKFSLQQAAVAIKAIEGFYNILMNFFEKYNSEPFNLANYVNMNRIGKAERLFEAATEKIKKLEKFSYLLRFHSLGLLFVCSVRWIKRARINLPKRANQTLDLEDSFREVMLPKTQELDNAEDQSQDPLFNGADNKDGLWPASPINTSFALEVSLNSTITNFVSNIPKTLFTPGIFSQRPPTNPNNL